MQFHVMVCELFCPLCIGLFVFLLLMMCAVHKLYWCREKVYIYICVFPWNEMFSVTANTNIYNII